MTGRWVKVLDNAGFTKRDCAVAFNHSGRMWISGGYDNGGVDLRDLQIASDLSGFSPVNPSVPFKAYAPICSHRGWIYILDDSLMRTKDGLTFETIPTNNTPSFSGQSPLLSLNGSLVQIRPDSVCVLNGDTWSSHEAPWNTPRAFYAATVFNGRVYAGCGAKTNQANSPPESGYPAFTSYGDMYSTATVDVEGSWVKHEVPFSPRMWPAMHAFGGSLYLVGGYNNFKVATNFDDTYRMGTDGEMKRVNTASSFTARHAPSLWDWNGRLVLGAGNTSAGTGTQCDLWELREE